MWARIYSSKIKESSPTDGRVFRVVTKGREEGVGEGLGLGTPPTSANRLAEYDD